MPEPTNRQPCLDERIGAIVPTAELLLKQGEDTSLEAWISEEGEPQK